MHNSVIAAMLSTAVVEHGVKKFTPVGIFTLSMILLGALVNKFPPEEENVVIGRDFFCNQFPARNLSANVTRFHNFTSDNRLLSSFGLSTVALVLPLMPLVIPVLSLGTLPTGETRGGGGLESAFRNQLENFEEPHASAKNELNRIALRFALQLFVGQASCFGSTELAKHFIVNPDGTFFEKCRLTRNACRALESYNLLVFRVGGNGTSSSNVPLLCNDAAAPDSEMHESLHSLPNTPSAIAGSSLVMFLMAMWIRRKMIDRVSKEKEVSAQTIVRTPQMETAEAGGPINREELKKKDKQTGKILSILQESNPYFKVGMLLVSLCLLSILLVDRYREQNISPHEIAGSIVYGMVIQCLVNVFYAVKKNSVF